MNNTYQILINWDKGQAFAERMAAKILGIEGYSAIDPQNPVGGPDGTKDIICSKNDKKYVVGCYFPNGQKDYSSISKKFNNDFAGVGKNKADGFVFVTNQKITPGERISLCKGHTDSTIFHGEKIVGVLDSPKGYGVRLEYLGSELTKEEQISFLNSHLDLKESYEEIKSLLDDLKRVSVRIAGAIDDRDLGFATKLYTPPVAGVPISSRLSVEDLFAIHLSCLYENRGVATLRSEGFRKVQTWIGVAGSSLENADFIPPSPELIGRQVNELLSWWREKYMDVCYAKADVKIAAIAEFHARFLSIHPFLDGNGRVVRVISTLQWKDLLNEEVIFEKIENVSTYYKALQDSREGNLQNLVDVFMALTK